MRSDLGIGRPYLNQFLFESKQLLNCGLNEQ